MNKKTNLKLLILSVGFLSLLFIMPKSAWAVFSIKATPIDMGSELVFRANPGETVLPIGVKIKITTDQAKQYEIRQDLMSEPSKGGGDRTPWTNFGFRGLIGTNSSGTFHVVSDSPMPLRAANPIYTSNTGGSADEFILVYNLTVPLEAPSGEYRGQIGFLLNPLVSGPTRTQDYLNIVICVGTSVPPERPKSIELIPSTGLKTIILSSKREETKSADVEVKINGQFKNVFSIAQILPEPLLSNEGNKLDYSAINFQTNEVSKGMGAPLTPLSSPPQTIYTSGPNGEVDPGFIITYSLGDLSGQKAGRYSGNIKYSLRQAGKESALETLRLEVENERIFDLVLTPQEQKGTIEFVNLKPREGPKKSEVIIEIKTNIGKKYQVNQNVNSDLTDKAGNIIPSKYFTLKTESLDTKGTLKFSIQQEVRKGDTVLFVSDDKGSADKFKIIYELTVPEDIKAGDYSTQIAYSLSEI